MNRKGPKYGFSFVVLHEEPSMTGFCDRIHAIEQQGVVCETVNRGYC